LRGLPQILSALFVALLAAMSHAEPAPIVVWYRASEECPAGPDFLARLGARAAATKLAGAGDHIDFVVTLVATDTETVGRLERQTQAGTVAIRELRDASCERVADALSLSLALSLPSLHEATVADTNVPTAVEPTTEQAPINLPPRPVPKSTVEPLPRASPAPLAVTKLASSGRLGARAGAVVGIMPDAMARAEVHLELDGLLPRVPSHPFLRVGALAALGSRHTAEAGPIREWIGAGRLQGCPWRIGKQGASVFPCLAVEIGAMSVSNGRTSVTSVGWWLAGATGLGGRVDLTRWLALEVEAELQLPLVRNQIAADSRLLYRSAPLTFQAGLGLSARLW